MASTPTHLIHLDYPKATMYELVERAALANPTAVAYDFYNTKTTYTQFIKRIDRVAKAFVNAGIKPGDAVTICMPNVPQTIDSFYALNKIGAVANMVHPLSARDEISFYLNVSKSKMIVTLDLFYEKVEEALTEVDHPVTIIMGSIMDELNPVLAMAFFVKKGKNYTHFPNTEHAITWKNFIRTGDEPIELPIISFDEKRTAVILYSGGTSGFPKGICLSDLNFNACALQSTASMGADLRAGYRMLSCMPCFHGFGLGINIHTVLINGATCVLMPTFTAETYAKMLIKKKPNFIAGVPTIFEALLHLKMLDGEDLSFLKGMYCGGDSLSVGLKRKIDEFLKEHKATIQIREGYGLTECVTASCLTPADQYREGGIGFPYPDTVYCIVDPGTEDVVPYGTEGEIILTGPSVMLGYLNSEEENKRTLRTLPDGRVWLYTGDLGRMDEDGYVYFSQRIKRMIITNGYNVYPSQLENAIDSHPDVSYSCVIGVKDKRRGQRIKAYIVLKNKNKATDEMKKEIIDHMSLQVAGYALPREIEFRDELPKTLVGKVAFRELEKENE
ncbi:MAG: acyl--CoA ligase [Lachnospiraceae bacterium]|nr:acyl--CoA ligase [Lachnospiraceae bacterium]